METQATWATPINAEIQNGVAGVQELITGNIGLIFGVTFVWAGIRFGKRVLNFALGK